MTRATHAAVVGALVLTPWLGLVSHAAGQPVNLYVSTAGNDEWSGLAAEPADDDGPFASLVRARDELRRLRAAGELPAGATVHIRAGTYTLTEPLALGPEDAGSAEAPVVFRGYEGERPRLVGALPVSGWRPWRDGIMQADLKGTALEGVVFRQLFFNGTRQVMARYPNVDPDDVHFGQWAHVLDADGRKDAVMCTDDVIKDWTNVERAEVCIHPSYGWAWMVIPVKSVDRETNEIRLARGTHYGQRVGDRFYVQNLLEELDAPGEWYLDRDTSTLYSQPPGDIEGAEVLAPVTQTLIAFEGTSHVTVRGFLLDACDGTAVTLRDAEDCMIAGSEIRNCGSWGVTISGGRRSGAFGNDIHATGAGGVSLDGGDRATMQRGDNFATNNYIHHIAAFQRTYNTGVNVRGVGNTASHNLIHDCYHQGMLMGGNDNTVELNIIHHTNLGSEDTGGIYMSSRNYTVRGNVIRHNIFHHVGGFGKANSWAPVSEGRVKFEYPHFTWAIYLDAPETGVHVHGNVMYEVPTWGMFNHSGKDNTWENNIVVDAPAFRAGVWGRHDLFETSWSHLRKAREENWPGLAMYPDLARYDENEARANTMFNCRFVRNIAYYTEEGSRWGRERNAASWQGGQVVWAYRGHPDDFPEFEFDHNLVYAPDGVEARFELNLDGPGRRLLTWDEWRETGQDAKSLFADPLFVDPANHDYRLRPESPALALGFEPIPFERIGPYEDDLRASWPIVKAPGAWQLGTFTTERHFQLPGHEPVEAREITPRVGLPNFFGRLEAGEPVTIVVFAGGNHAQGGWREAVVRNLRERHPQAQITTVDASICGCVRGSGFSVYRFAHEVLRHEPDLVIVDFAADDGEGEAGAVQAAIEGMVRQARAADPDLDVLFAYAFRPGYEEAYAEGLAPGAVSAHERVAEHYGIPSVNMGYRVAQMAREGALVIRASREEAEGLEGKAVFTHDGVQTTPAAFGIYAQVISEALAQLAEQATPRRHDLPAPVSRRHLESARQVAITPEVPEGEWERMSPTDIGGKDFSRHFEDVWFTDTPGATLTFTFRGTGVSIFNLMGPDTGQVRVTVDGRDAGVRQQVDPWAYYQRLSALSIASGLEDGEHTVTIELLPEAPDRSVPIGEAQKAGRYRPEDFEGVALRFGWIRVIGEGTP